MDRFVIIGFFLLSIGIAHSYPQFNNGNQFGEPWENPWFRPEQPSQPPITQDGGASSTTTTTARPTTQSPRYYACFQSCPATSEYNPICGSDNVNYYNENRFNCALNCGLRIQQVHKGIC
ncbi:uncharacterized protein LOC108105269 [Drosophila eugracilis]|uniref:uncharacterized protein LOC108105269 n=1 Tax=Drosophila eugracilis TaxID=29029 RepID=UPI001BD9C8F5|nr:uncharacterized protein LOC108105269 [Drosophila eugracilis]